MEIFVSSSNSQKVGRRISFLLGLQSEPQNVIDVQVMMIHVAYFLGRKWTFWCAVTILDLIINV